MRLVIHCGLHKTGSTTLQSALVDMAPSLESHGVSYPSYQTGEVFAHHWLAKSIKGPHAFRKAQGNIAGMIDVIKASNPHTVCFSSEDFETHLRNPKALARLMEIADQLNAKPVFLVYLRNQVEYLESLYLQFLRMGLGLDASDVIDQVVETGQFAWRKWVIQFDYAAMIDALIATNSNVMVRNYHALESNCIIQDFLTCIDQPADLKSNAESKRLNSARLSGNLQRFVTNREGNLDVQAIADIDNKLSGLRPRLSQNAQQRLKDRFWAGNQDIEAKFGVSLNQRFGRTASTNPVPVIDRLFATDTIDFLSRFFGMNNPAAAQTRGIDLPEDWLAAV